MFEPRHIPEEQRLNKKQRFVVVMMNMLLLGELTFSMYLGQQDPDNLTMTFLKLFLPMASLTLVASRLLMRRLGAAVAPPGAG